jgi:hypothetical protein
MIIAMYDIIHSIKFFDFLFSALSSSRPPPPIPFASFRYFPIPASISSKDTDSSSDIAFEIPSLQRAQRYIPSVNITYRNTSKSLLLLSLPQDN